MSVIYEGNKIEDDLDVGLEDREAMPREADRERS